LTRRAALRGAGVGVGTLAAAHVMAPGRAEAASSNIYAVVDVGGGGDFTDLENAVQSVPADSTIFVKRGTYQIQSGAMHPAAGVRILGEGYGTHIRAKDGLNADLFQIQADNVTLENLRIDGNQTAQVASSGHCVKIDGVQGAQILNCYIHDASNYNLVGYPGTTRAVIQGNHVYSSHQEGIELMGGSFCSIVGNVVWDVGTTTTAAGIFLWTFSAGSPECQYNTVSGNVVSGSHYGIQVSADGHHNVITGNTATANMSHGIVISNAGPNVVSGNVVTANPANGVHIDRSPNCVVSDNLVSSNSQAGIRVVTSDGTAVTGNSVTDNGWHGIDIVTGTDSAFGGTCTGNVCVGNGTDTSQSRRAGIGVSGPYKGVVVANNRCYDPKSAKTQLYGVLVLDNKSSDVLVGPNIVGGNAQTGIRVDSTATSAYSVPYRKLTASVGPGQTAIPHGLPYAPRAVTISMTSAGTIWRSAAPDDTNIYLKADAQSRNADVYVG
jgi:parallel beta-helix repeat protein